MVVQGRAGKALPLQKGTQVMGTKKQGNATPGTVHIRATVSGEEKTVATITGGTVKTFRRGTARILKGGADVASGVFDIAISTVKVVEQKGQKVLQGASLTAARKAITEIVQAAAGPGYVSISETVHDAIVDHTALILLVNRHRKRCVGSVHVEGGASLAAVRFLTMLKAGQPVDRMVARNVATALGASKKFDASRPEVPDVLMTAQESLLALLVSHVDEGGTLAGRKGRAYVKDVRSTLGLLDTDKVAGGRGGRQGKPVTVTVAAALDRAGATFGDMDRKVQGATDAQTAQKVLRLMRDLEKVTAGIGPCAGLKSIRKVAMRMSA
jgi:hypothetical protein